MNYTAIVVDDEKLIAGNIAKNITRANELFEVTAIFYDGLEAYDAIKELLPDVVFLDIHMPEMDGLELAKKIAQDYPFITCVIISGYDDFEYARAAIQYNVKDYLLKPINLDELKVTLANIEKKLIASRSSLEKHLDQKNPEEIVALVKEYISQNYGSQIDLGAMAASFGFSLSWLTKLFTKHMNVTPSKYIKEYRMNIAKTLLRDPNLPISAISQETGFLDQFHFSKTFKQATGMSPSEYRAQTKKDS